MRWNTFHEPVELGLQYGQMGGSKGGMPCTMCPHVGCKHSFLRQGVTPCPDCDPGTLILDPLSAPKWRLDCNLCSFLIYLPDNLHSVKVEKENVCEVWPDLVITKAMMHTWVLRVRSQANCWAHNLLQSWANTKAWYCTVYVPTLCGILHVQIEMQDFAKKPLSVTFSLSHCCKGLCPPVWYNRYPWSHWQNLNFTRSAVGLWL